MAIHITMANNLQQQIADLKRQNILEATAKVFAEKGYHASTIKDIAHEAGVADGTIYNYFKNKSALLVGVLNLLRERAYESNDVFTALDTTDIRTFLRIFIAQPIFNLQANDFALFRVIISEAMINEELRQLYYEQIIAPMLNIAEPMLQHWVEKGDLRPVDLTLLARTLSNLIIGTMIQAIMRDDYTRQHWDELPDLMTDLLLTGIGAKDA
jgi:AcrR family transcriptional regulator